MNKTLMQNKYNSLLISGMVAMLVEYVVLLANSIIVGQMIGEDGLSAITLVTPYFMLIVFFQYAACYRYVCEQE